LASAATKIAMIEVTGLDFRKSKERVIRIAQPLDGLGVLIWELDFNQTFA
jgi:hypothetical protein